MKKDQIYYYKKIKSPIGILALVATNRALVALGWGEDLILIDKIFSNPIKDESNKILEITIQQITEYFKKERTIFDIPIDPAGTEFQKKVWNQLLKIPYGQCITYGEQAKRIGSPKASRAVGAANGKNPIGLVIPCHRVIGTSGKLIGFAGGLEMKKKLIEHEAKGFLNE